MDRYRIDVPRNTFTRAKNLVAEPNVTQIFAACTSTLPLEPHDIFKSAARILFFPWKRSATGPVGIRTATEFILYNGTWSLILTKVNILYQFFESKKTARNKQKISKSAGGI
jgi:hypothetical protein